MDYLRVEISAATKKWRMSRSSLRRLGHYEVAVLRSACRRVKDADI